MARPKIGYQHFCPAARALEVIGEKWSLLVVRDLLAGPRRFSDLRRTLTAGVVHALGPARPGGRRWIHADVRLAPGNSGGPLADTAGQVVGINTMIAGGLALAIPINDVRRFVTSTLASAT